MRDLIGQFSAVDDDAASVLRVISHFDTLVERRAGLSSFVRAAAALSGYPAGLRDPAGARVLRSAPDGVPLPEAPLSQEWSRHVVDVDSGVIVWLEHAAPSPVLALVLERFAGGVRVTLDRTRQGLSYADAVRIAIDEDSDTRTRDVALRRLAVAEPAMVLALDAGDVPVERTGIPDRLTAQVLDVRACILPSPLHGVQLRAPARAGAAMAKRAADLPQAWNRALVALRFAGHTGLHGPVVHYEELGAIATVAEAVSQESASADPDVTRLRELTREHGWPISTLEAVLASSSLRQAATQLHIHHSTLQERLSRLEVWLGFSPISPAGRIRVGLALVLHSCARTEPDQA
ncbi:MAG: helix-turn-helix domain-containing protein [Actinomycetales bacterium]